MGVGKGLFSMQVLLTNLGTFTLTLFQRLNHLINYVESWERGTYLNPARVVNYC